MLTDSCSVLVTSRQLRYHLPKADVHMTPRVCRVISELLYEVRTSITSLCLVQWVNALFKTLTRAVGFAPQTSATKCALG